VSPSIPQPIRNAQANEPAVKHPGESESLLRPKVLNLSEAAALVRCSRAHLSNIANGKVRGIPRLPTVRIGRRVLFRRESLELWLEEVESMAPARNSR
jgi:Helix-turn-helix domain